MPLRRSLVRPALLTAAVLGLLAVVALASRADRPARPADPTDRTLPLAFWDYLVTFGLLAVVGVLALALYLKVPVSAPERRRFGFLETLAVVAVAGLVMLAGTRMEYPDITYPAGIEDVFVDAPAEVPEQQPTEGSRREPVSPRLRLEVFVAAGAVVLLGVLLFVVRRRAESRGASADEGDTASALSAALDDSLEDLHAERDPRRAVIAAYARMERVLERRGFARQRAEAPLEYLARVLRGLRVRSSAVLALTELFERAKFSRHEIDVEMKEEAIGALIAVRDDLKTAS